MDVPSEPTPPSSRIVVVGGCTTPTTESESFRSKFETEYDKKGTLGEGGQGIVYEVIHVKDKKRYAVKRIKFRNKNETIKRIMQEAHILALLTHSNVIYAFKNWIEFPPSDEGLSLDEMYRLSSSEPSEEYSDSRTPFDWHDQILTDNSTGGGAETSSGGIDFASEENESRGTETSSGGIDFASEENESRSTDTSSGGIDFACEQNESRGTGTSSGGIEFGREEKESSRSKIDGIKDECTSIKTFGYFYIQMELCKKESLHDWLKNNKERKTTAIRKTFYQIVAGLSHIHDKNIIHRDLKPANILFSLQDSVKICDLGLAKLQVEDRHVMSIDTYTDRGTTKTEVTMEGTATHTKDVGTLTYVSPEQKSTSSYSLSTDIYSLGIILFEMLRHFDSGSERAHVIKALKDDKKFPVDFETDHPEAHNLIRRMLSEDPSERPTAKDILYDDFLRSSDANLIPDTLSDDIDVMNAFLTGESVSDDELPPGLAVFN